MVAYAQCGHIFKNQHQNQQRKQANPAIKYPWCPWIQKPTFPSPTLPALFVSWGIWVRNQLGHECAAPFAGAGKECERLPKCKRSLFCFFYCRRFCQQFLSMRNTDKMQIFCHCSLPPYSPELSETPAWIIIGSIKWIILWVGAYQAQMQIMQILSKWTYIFFWKWSGEAQVPCDLGFK